MQNKQARPSSNGLTPRESHLNPFKPTSAKVSVLAALFIILTAGNGFASMHQLVQELNVHIDTAQGKLTATSQIKLPAQDSADIFLNGLNVTSASIDGAVIDPSEIIEKRISLVGSNYDRNIVVNYEILCKNANRGQCIIDESTAVMIGIWHPTLNRDAIYKLTADIPTSFEAVSEADQTSSEINGNTKTVKFNFAHPVRAINFVAGPYIVEEELFGDGQQILSYFFAEDQELAALYREKAKTYLQRYIDMVGPYPYKRFAIVENRLPTGYAMPTFTLLGQSVVRLPFIVDTSLGHEVLHSWFGNAVRVDRNSGNWGEGLTTYLADQTFAADKNEDVLYRKTQMIKYANYVSAKNNISLSEFVGAGLDKGRESQAQRAVGYGKSSMVFHMLRQKFGQETFTKAIQDFYSRMNNKIADWRDIQTSFENVTSTDLKVFFDQWLNRQDLPIITVKDLAFIEKEGQLNLSFALVQQNQQPYTLDLSLDIESKGQLIRKTIHTEETTTKVSFPLASYPDQMTIDPEYDLMRMLYPSEMPPVWDSFTGAENSLAVINSPSTYTLYEDLIAELEKLGTEVLAADEITDKDLTDRAVIFLGTSGAVPRGLFAQPSFPAEGVTIDIRKNPLNPQNVAILVSANDPMEVAKAAGKLRHYGKYSYLHFVNGRAVEKFTKPANLGQQYTLDVPPLGVKMTNTLNFSQIITELNSKRVVYAGESHTKYEDHLLQLRVIRELFHLNPRLAIGMEMFPRSSQKALDDFISGKIDEKTFLKDSKYFEVWSFDYRLYREILNFAKQNQLPVIGLNIDKKHVSKVYKEGGISSLEQEDKFSIPVDRQLDLPSYRERLNAIFSVHPTNGGTSQFANFLQAQAIWDETMAESIVSYLTDHPDDRMIVLAGRGHVVIENAIPPRVTRRLPMEQSIIVSSEGGVVNPAEADFVIFQPQVNLPPRALIGISMKEDKENNLVLIDALSPEGAGKKAGIKAGDILVALDDQPITTIDDVKIIMVFKEIGDKIKVDIKRPHTLFADEEMSFDIVL